MGTIRLTAEEWTKKWGQATAGSRVFRKKDGKKVWYLVKEQGWTKDGVAKKIVKTTHGAKPDECFANWDEFEKYYWDNYDILSDAWEMVAELYAKYRVEEETEKMRKALEAIKNPIKHLQDLAEIEGNKINGSTAIALANSPDFYRNIAEKALNP